MVGAARLRSRDTITSASQAGVRRPLPIMVWMLYSAFKEVPNDILEAVRLDGATVLVTGGAGTIGSTVSRWLGLAANSTGITLP